MRRVGRVHRRSWIRLSRHARTAVEKTTQRRPAVGHGEQRPDDAPKLESETEGCDQEHMGERRDDVDEQPEIDEDPEEREHRDQEIRWPPVPPCRVPLTQKSGL